MEARSTPGEDAEIVVVGPDGVPRQTVTLSGDRVTVGRLPDLNTVALQPDPELFVSREAHCAFEREGPQWLVVDGGSVNGTYIRRAGTLEQVVERAELQDGDAVCVLAAFGAAGERRFFELVFRAAGATQATRQAPTVGAGSQACLSYDLPAARLVLVDGAARHEIRLRPQGHRLVRHLAERNAAGEGGPVLCSHDELMHAVWGDEPLHTRLELARLVWELRRELRRFGAEHLVESERQRGYRLRTCADR
jgi:FHA domain-containing protein